MKTTIQADCCNSLCVYVCTVNNSLYYIITTQYTPQRIFLYITVQYTQYTRDEHGVNTYGTAYCTTVRDTPK